MTDFRVFCQPSEAEPTVLVLTAGESHHLVAVNRARPGDTVVAFDGRGREWTCELVEAGRSAARLAVRRHQRRPPLPSAITLGQALPKGPAMEAIIRKATEIGAAVIAPLASERTEVHLAAERAERKTGKWQLAALEAAKQCGNPFLPEILPVQPARRCLEQSQGHDLRLIASLHPGARRLQDVLGEYRAAHGRDPQKVLLLIGPEGDFTPAEMSAAQTHGFAPITLGPLVLRCETAAVYALSVLSYELQGA